MRGVPLIGAALLLSCIFSSVASYADRFYLSKDRLIEGILIREIGSFIPVGKSNALNLYELICRSNDATQEQVDGCTIFASALQNFRVRRWREASEKFFESKECFGKDGVSDFYVNLCKLYQQESPGDSWDGIIHLERK